MAETTLENVTFEQVARDVERLTPDEQRQLHTLLDGRLAASKQEWTPEQNEHLLRRLRETGLVVHAPTEAPDLERIRTYRPVTVQGRPVSETLLEERR